MMSSRGVCGVARRRRRPPPDRWHPRVASRSFRPLSPKRNTRPMTEARPGTARRRRGVDRRARGVTRFGHSPHGWCCLRACVRDARREEGRRAKPRRAIRLLEPDPFSRERGPETNLTKRRLTKCPPAVLCGKVNSPMTPPRSRARCSDRAPRGRNSKRLPRRGTSRRHAGGAFTDADGVPGAGSDSADPSRRSSSPRKPVSLNPRAP